MKEEIKLVESKGAVEIPILLKSTIEVIGRHRYPFCSKEMDWVGTIGDTNKKIRSRK